VTGKCKRAFTGHAGPVTCLGLSDSRMCTGSEYCEVRLYSFKNGQQQSLREAGKREGSSSLSSPGISGVARS
jgi:F-box/WD-40 domain protein MET30